MRVLSLLLFLPLTAQAGAFDCGVYYGEVFACGQKLCAKSDPAYQNICVITPQSTPYRAPEPPAVRVTALSADAACGQTPAYDVVTLKAYDPVSGLAEESLRVFFQDFTLSAESPGDYAKNCRLDARVAIPAGYRFRPLSAAAEGSYSIAPAGESRGFIRVSYEVQPQDWRAEASNAKAFTGTGEILCTAALEERPTVDCASEPSEVNLLSDLSLSLFQRGTGFSLMEIDASRRDVDLSWKWELEPCSAYFEGRDFQSSYTAYNGKRISANLRFAGRTGSYATASFTGYLSQLRYSEGGRRVEGRWEASGQGGSFDFRLQDPASGRFEGYWLDGDKPGTRYPWSGSYL